MFAHLAGHRDVPENQKKIDLVISCTKILRQSWEAVI